MEDIIEVGRFVIGEDDKLYKVIELTYVGLTIIECFKTGKRIEVDIHDLGKPHKLKRPWKLIPSAQTKNEFFPLY